AAEQVQSSQDPAAAAQRFAGQAAHTGRQMLLLIEDLVLWERLRLGAAAHAGVHPVQSVIAPAIALHQALAGQKGISLVLHIPEGIAVSVDIVMAQTLVRNLLDNAFKSARHAVIFKATHAANGVELSIHDDGHGLPGNIFRWLKTGEGAPHTGL